MNEELLLLYNGLDQQRRLTLRQSFEGSPRAMRFLDVLETTKDKLKTTKAVNHIYADELNEVDYQTLVNRFYKLRKYIKDRLLAELKRSDNYFTQPELTLGYARYLVSINAYKLAFEQLKKLETECWEDELFELLPDIIKLLIYCVQVLNTSSLDILDEYEERFLRAIALQNTLQKLQLDYQRLYRPRYSKAEAFYKKVMRRMRKVKERHPNVFRFRMIYHYTAFVRGCFLDKFANKAANALTRHLNNFWELQNQHPQSPLFYLRKHHYEHTKLHLNLIQAAYLFHNGKFSDALAVVKERSVLRKKYRCICPPLSESELRNTITIYTCNGVYEKAYELAWEMLDFFEEQEEHERKYMAYAEMVTVFFFAYPDAPLHNREAVYEKVKEGLDNVTDPLVKLMLLMAKASLELLEGDPKIALTINQRPQIQAMYQQLGVDASLVTQVIEAYCHKNKTALEQLLPQLEKMLNETSLAIPRLYYQRFIDLCRLWLNE